MSDLGNPIEAFLQAQQMKNNNSRNMYSDIAGIGQGLGQGFNSIGQAMQDQQKKKILQQIIQAMQTQGSPQQGPPLAPAGTPQPNMTQIPPGQPMSAGSPNIGQDVQMNQPIPTQTPGQQPTSGMGAPAQDNSQLIQQLMMKYDPQAGIKSYMENQDPYRKSQIALANSETEKNLRPPQQKPEYGAYGESPTGTGLVLDKYSGKVSDTGVKVAPKKDPAAQGIRSDARQDRLEKSYADRLQKVISNRSGGLGMQDQKVDQAIHLRSMVNQSYNPQTKTYEIPEMQQGELVMGLANLVSGSSVGNMEQLRSITPKTAQGDMAHLISYWTGTPITNQPQQMIKNLVSSIDRQGKVSEQLRDKYMNGLKALKPKDLEKERADSISNANLTSSFSDILKESPDMQGSSGSYSDAGKEARYQAWKKSQGL